MEFSTALHSSHKAALSDAKNRREKFCMVNKENIKNSLNQLIAKLIEKKPLNGTNARDFNLHKSVSLVQKEFVYNDELSVFANVTKFINLVMPTTDDQIRDLAKFTESQAKCQQWGIHRHGRTTASIFHRLCTPVNTLQKKPDEVTDSFFETITEVNVVPTTNVINPGRALEPHAKSTYVQEINRTHLNFNCKDIGPVFFKQYSYLRASPDLIAECTCCGKGVV